MRPFLGWCSIACAVWSFVSYIVGLTDQAIYLSLISIYTLMLAKISE